MKVFKFLGLGLFLVYAALLWSSFGPDLFCWNDLTSHVRYVNVFLTAWSSGSLGLDGWDEHCCLGAPVFRLYQNLPHFFSAVVSRATGLGADQSLHVVLLTALCLHPIAFFVAGRLLGLGNLPSLVLAIVSISVSGDWPPGHALEAYLAAGYGLFTQALAAPAFVLSLALGYRATLKPGAMKQDCLLGWALAITFLCHHLHGAMAVLVVGIFFGMRFIAGTNRPALMRSGLVIGAIFLLLTGYQLLAILQDRALVPQSHWDDPRLWKGWGVWLVWKEFAQWRVLDSYRWPVLTALAVLGLLLGRKRSLHAPLWPIALVTMIVGLIGFIGSETFGFLSYIPILRTFHLERFIFLVHIGGIFFATSAVLWLLSIRVLKPVATGLAVVALGYLLWDRGLILSRERANMRLFARASQTSDRSFFSWLDYERKDGNVWANQKLLWRGASVYQALPSLGIPQVTMPLHGLSYASDTVGLINPMRPSDYLVFNVGMTFLSPHIPPPKFLNLAYESEEFKTYRGPYQGPVGIVLLSRVEKIRDEQAFVERTSQWLRSDEPSHDRYPALIPEAIARAYPDSVPLQVSRSSGPAGQVEWWTRRSSERYSALLKAASAGAYGVLHVSYHPRWKVRVNRRPVTPIWIGPGQLGFALEEGENQVELFFAPDPLRSAFFVLALGLMVLIPGLVLMQARVPLLVVGKGVPATS